MKLLLLLGLLLVGSAAATSAAERPNIVFLLADDQSSRTLGCYGHPIVQTPHLDALAARGARFDNACVSLPSAIAWRNDSEICWAISLFMFECA